MFAVKYIVCDVLKKCPSPALLSQKYLVQNNSLVSHKVHGISDAISDCWYYAGILAGSDSMRPHSTLCGSY